MRTLNTVHCITSHVAGNACLQKQMLGPATFAAKETCEF